MRSLRGSGGKIENNPVKAELSECGGARPIGNRPQDKILPHTAAAPRVVAACHLDRRIYCRPPHRNSAADLSHFLWRFRADQARKWEVADAACDSDLRGVKTHRSSRACLLRASRWKWRAAAVSPR